VIELACGDHGNDKIEKMAREIENGKCLIWTGISDLEAINDVSSGIGNDFRVIANYTRSVQKLRGFFFHIKLKFHIMGSYRNTLLPNKRNGSFPFEKYFETVPGL